MTMTRSVIPLRQQYLLRMGRLDFSCARAFRLPSQLRPTPAIGPFSGDGLNTSPHSFQLNRNKSSILPSLQIRAAKGKKPPPKPASLGIIIGAILLPLGMAASAVITGRILFERIKKQAMEEAKEWEMRHNPSRLLPDGKTEEERQLERENRASAGANDIYPLRSRPKREEE